jgi:ribosomal protein L37AE/L43A
MSAAFLPPEFHDSPDVERVCSRCGREKDDVEKRPNREWICATCWAAINAGDPMPRRTPGPYTHWDE